MSWTSYPGIRDSGLSACDCQQAVMIWPHSPSCHDGRTRQMPITTSASVGRSMRMNHAPSLRSGHTACRKLRHHDPRRMAIMGSLKPWLGARRTTFSTTSAWPSMPLATPGSSTKLPRQSPGVPLAPSMRPIPGPTPPGGGSRRPHAGAFAMITVSSGKSSCVFPTKFGKIWICWHPAVSNACLASAGDT